MFSYSFNIQNLVPSCLTMLQLQCRWQKPNIHDINSSLSANKGQKLVKHGHNSHFGRQTNSWCLKKRRSKGEPWCLEWKWRVMTHKNVAHDAYYICTTCGSQCQLAGFSIFAEKIWSNRKKDEKRYNWYLYSHFCTVATPTHVAEKGHWRGETTLG